MSYLEMSEEEIHNCVECGGLDDDMFFSLYEDAIEQIEYLKLLLEQVYDYSTENHGLDLKLARKVEKVLGIK